MASNSSNALWWSLIGFFLGVAATLGVIMWMGGPDLGPDRPDMDVRAAAAAPIAPPPRRAARQIAVAPPAEDPPASGSDEQVAEDAAAAGMTSRARAPAAPDQ